MTKVDKKYLDMVAGLGCIICKRIAEIHYIPTGTGLGERNSNRRVLPLCHDHHLGGGHGVAIHTGKASWENKFGTERMLWGRLNVWIENEKTKLER